jgi:hypothetical protein
MERSPIVSESTSSAMAGGLLVGSDWVVRESACGWAKGQEVRARAAKLKGGM